MSRAQKRFEKKMARKAASRKKLPPAGNIPPPQNEHAIQQPLDLAVQHHVAGRLAEAEKFYRTVLDADPAHPLALHMLGVIAGDMGNYAAAVDFITASLTKDPDNAEAHSNLGVMLQNLGNLEEAVSSYQAALAIMPEYTEGHFNLGNAFRSLGGIEEAAASFSKALACNPDHAEAHNNLGLTLLSRGNVDEAIASYRRALAIDDNFALAHYNLGTAYTEQGKPDEAVISYRKALAIEPDSAKSHNNLGKTFQDMGEMDESRLCFQKAIAIDPDFAGAYRNLGITMQSLGRLDEAVESYRQCLAIKPDFAEAQSNLVFSLNYIEDYNPAESFAEARRYGEMARPTVARAGKYSNTCDPRRQLRVGLVSGDFCDHPVSVFLERVLAEIDVNKVELFAYDTSSEVDDMTARLKAIVPHWRSVEPMGDDEFEATVIADEIDILVDLSGHTAHRRLELFSRKPAPVQMTWLGYFATTGIDAIDYILCDALTVPLGAESNFVEKPWRLPDICLCFTPPNQHIEVSALPAWTNSHVTFGSFSTLSKITDSVVACWAEILHGVPGSKLVLKARYLDEISAQEDIRSRFSIHGISPESLDLDGSSDKETYFRAHNLVDIVLSPFPYGGITTCVEALWMGTPMLALEGDRFISRVGGGILHTMGLGDWVADTPRDYIAKGIAFASDLPALSAMRAGLRDQLLRSPVCDAPRFSRNLEDAFRGMWTDWCEHGSP